jgi:hypothetical protein
MNPCEDALVANQLMKPCFEDPPIVVCQCTGLRFDPESTLRKVRGTVRLASSLRTMQTQLAAQETKSPKFASYERRLLRLKQKCCP